MSAQTVLFSFAAVKAPAARRQVRSKTRVALRVSIPNACLSTRERVSAYFHDDVTAR